MKGIILGHVADGSQVLDCEGSFRVVKGFKSQPVGSEIEFKPAPAINFSRVAAISLLLVVVVAIGGFSWLWNMDSYSVYVDINPSVELVFNKFNRIRSATPLCADGEELLAGLNLRGSPGSVVISLIREAENKGYITLTGSIPEIIITVATKADGTPYGNYFDICAELDRYGIRSLAIVELCDLGFLNQAEDFGVSPGKLMLAQQLHITGGQIPLSEILSTPVRSLVEMIREAGVSDPDPNIRGADENEDSAVDVEGSFTKDDDDKDKIDDANCDEISGDKYPEDEQEPFALGHSNPGNVPSAGNRPPEVTEAAADAGEPAPVIEDVPAETTAPPTVQQDTTEPVYESGPEPGVNPTTETPTLPDLSFPGGDDPGGGDEDVILAY